MLEVLPYTTQPHHHPPNPTHPAYHTRGVTQQVVSKQFLLKLGRFIAVLV